MNESQLKERIKKGEDFHEELLRLFQAGESIYYDETTVHRADFKDIDLDSFAEFLHNYMEIKANEAELRNYLKNLHMINENNKPTAAGILFFGRKPQFFFQSSRVICAYIKEKDLAALKEGVVNAIAHKDYTVAAPIRVILYEDRLEIRTPGKLPNSVTIDSMKIGGSHILRNPTIYNLLYKMGMVTDLGSGVRRIITLVRAHSQKEVLLQETDTEFILTIPRPKPNNNS